LPTQVLGTTASMCHLSCLLHVQGAVMLLLEGVCGRVLHTGDFRYV
jgi:hypothetical protein